MASSSTREKWGLPLTFDVKVRCPAGRPIGDSPRGSGCYCRITSSPLTADEDPGALVEFCTSEYEACPVWRAARGAEVEGHLKAFLGRLDEAARHDLALAAQRRVAQQETLYHGLVERLVG